MTPLNRRASHNSAHRPAREARIRRSFDGVVAAYIRELSASGPGCLPARRGTANATLQP